MKGPDTSFQLLACSYVQEQAKTLLAHIDNIRSGDDIELIHQARVASRRICTALGVFKATFPPRKVRRWSKHIQRLIKGLGAARDKDVQIEFVAGKVTDRARGKNKDLPGLKRLLLRLRQEREDIQPGVIEVLDQIESTGTLSEILAQTKKIRSRLRKAGAGLSRPFVLGQAARDIRKKCNRLLRFQSCLEDAGAIEQHHRMRIAAKKLRYTMEIYKKVFEKRLNNTIKVVRNVQTLLGDIHDCDVWCDMIPRFSEEERQRTVRYYGHARTFQRLRPGFDYLRDERATCRREKFNELGAFWRGLQDRGFWEELIAGLEALQAGSGLEAFLQATIQTEKPVPEVEDVPEGPDSEAPGLAGTRSSQTECPEPPDENEEVSSSAVLASDKEEWPSWPSTNGEVETEADGATPPVAAEQIDALETPSQQESSLPDRAANDLSAPEALAGSSAAPVESAICECCGRNSFLVDELSRIDSGQLLCPGCLGALHEKTRLMDE